MKNLSDILSEMEQQGFELGKVYTDKDKPPFKVLEDKLNEEDNPYRTVRKQIVKVYKEMSKLNNISSKISHRNPTETEFKHIMMTASKWLISMKKTLKVLDKGH